MGILFYILYIYVMINNEKKRIKNLLTYLLFVNYINRNESREIIVNTYSFYLISHKK